MPAEDSGAKALMSWWGQRMGSEEAKGRVNGQTGGTEMRVSSFRGAWAASVPHFFKNQIKVTAKSKIDWTGPVLLQSDGSKQEQGDNQALGCTWQSTVQLWRAVPYGTHGTDSPWPHCFLCPAGSL